MTKKVAFLYESDEWSNCTIMKYLEEANFDVSYIDMETFDTTKFNYGEYDFFVNRVFPSADMRNNLNALPNTFSLLKILNNLNIPVITGLTEFTYDCDKYLSYQKLYQAGVDVPNFQLINSSNHNSDIHFPALLKKICGGRSYQMKYLSSENELRKMEINEQYLLQNYIEPETGFITRVEFFGYDDYFILKRLLDDAKIGSYSRESKYIIYDDYTDELINISIKALRSLNIEMGSLDIIEKSGKYYVIDANATSNFSRDYIDLLGFDPIKKMSNYIIKKGEFYGRR